MNLAKMSKSKSLFLGRFKGLGGMGVCGNHWKWSQFCACKIWWKSIRKPLILWPTHFLYIFLKKFFWGSRRSEPHGGAMAADRSVSSKGVGGSRRGPLLLPAEICLIGNGTAIEDYASKARQHGMAVPQIIRSIRSNAHAKLLTQNVIMEMIATDFETAAPRDKPAWISTVPMLWPHGGTPKQ